MAESDGAWTDLCWKGRKEKGAECCVLGIRMEGGEARSEVSPDSHGAELVPSSPLWLHALLPALVVLPRSLHALSVVALFTLLRRSCVSSLGCCVPAWARRASCCTPSWVTGCCFGNLGDALGALISEKAAAGGGWLGHSSTAVGLQKWGPACRAPCSPVLRLRVALRRCCWDGWLQGSI